MSDKLARPGLILAFLTFLNVLNFVDRQLIPSLAPLLIEDLGLTRAQIGLLYGFVFVVFYTAMGMVLGAAADRWNRPRLMAVGLALWSLLTAASGAAGSFMHLALARVFVGVGEATLTPAAMSMLSDVFPAKRRALASGVYYAGVPIGSGLSLIVSGMIAPTYGWRWCFYSLGLLGICFLPLLLIVSDPPRGFRDLKTPHSQTFAKIASTLLGSLAASPALTLTILGGVTINFFASALTHVITWMAEERGFDYQAAAFRAGGTYLAAGVVGVTMGGLAADWFHRRFAGGRLYFLAAVMALGGPLAIAFFVAVPGESVLFLPAWFVTSLTGTIWFGPIFATVQDLVPARIRSTVVAFLLLALSLLGTGPGPWITGLIGDARSLTEGLVIATAVGMLAALPLFFAGRRYSADVAAVRA